MDNNDSADSESEVSSLEMEDNIQHEKPNFKDDRRPSNLFRAQSRDAWKKGDLEEQENALKEQMKLLSNSYKSNSVEETDAI